MTIEQATINSLMGHIEALEDTIKTLEGKLCVDSVSRKEVKEKMLKYGFKAPDMTVTEFVEDELSSVLPPIAKGKWIRQTEEHNTNFASVVIEYYECEYCGHKVGIDNITNYCPNCGAEMEIKENDND